MKPITLTQLREAIHFLRNSEVSKTMARFHPSAWETHVVHLEQAVAFLAGEDDTIPNVDPRLILEGLKYEW